MMKALCFAWKLFPLVMLALPPLAFWLWRADGMWNNGAMPTHALSHITTGSLIALAAWLAAALLGRKEG